MFVKEEVANYILTIPEEGAASYETFRTDRLSSNKNVAFHTPIQRKKILMFGECKKRTTITKSNKSKKLTETFWESFYQFLYVKEEL